MKKDNEKRVEDLLAFSLGIMNGEKGTLLLQKYKEAIEHVTPHDMLDLEDKQMQMGITPEAIKKDVNKVINVFFNKLREYSWEKPKEGVFLYYLMLENQAYEFELNRVKKIIKSYKGREVSDFSLLKRICWVISKGFQNLNPTILRRRIFYFHSLKRNGIIIVQSL